ncbi:MAG: UDP-N-acetylmuramoyl-L-alanyl-D-glutamate--2,6-diaminopimelate ligase [Bacteroidales bacterium]
MRLNELIYKDEAVTITNDSNPHISSVTFDSRDVAEDSLFVAIKGSVSDGHDYIKQAIENGATAVLCEKMPVGLADNNRNHPVTIIQTESSHKMLGLVSSRFYGNPSSKMKVVGITGTNGKTTTVTLLYNLFTSLGYICGLISTIDNYVGTRRYPSTHTTPDPLSLNKLMFEMNKQGCEFCFMEVSSHALDQDRVCGIKFEGALFSNITHDHLDYHKDFLSYINAKKKLFDNLPSSSFALVNIDDRNGKTMVQNCNANTYTYSCLSHANFNCKVIESTLEGMLMKIGTHDVWAKFIGLHNAYNLLAVYSTAILLGGDQQEVLTALSALENVAGRLEYIKGANDITAVVDYAHTPDALSNVLRTLKEVSTDTQLVTVFGCGGNRDKSKRPEMARVSARYSDKIIVTSDNPRFEDPDEIIKEIKTGFENKELVKTLFITDRREAIKAALTMASPGAIVLVAGKGHETYQDVKGVKEHFDDKEEINNVFNLMS